jgi:TRAP-type uncharacterized transport system fused permease subunit
MIADWQRPAVFVPTVIALAMVAFHLWVVFTGAPEVFHFRGTHLGFGLVLTFLWYRTFTDAQGSKRLIGGIVDATLLVVSLCAIGRSPPCCSCSMHGSGPACGRANSSTRCT